MDTSLVIYCFQIKLKLETNIAGYWKIASDFRGVLYKKSSGCKPKEIKYLRSGIFSFSCPIFAIFLPRNGFYWTTMICLLGSFYEKPTPCDASDDIGVMGWMTFWKVLNRQQGGQKLWFGGQQSPSRCCMLLFFGIFDS
jgi:hypothetical protein